MEKAGRRNDQTTRHMQAAGTKMTHTVMLARDEPVAPPGVPVVQANVYPTLHHHHPSLESDDISCVPSQLSSASLEDQ